MVLWYSVKYRDQEQEFWFLMKTLHHTHWTEGRVVLEESHEELVSSTTQTKWFVLDSCSNVL